MDAAERFAGSLRAAEERLRATGLHGRQAYLALVRHLAQRLELPAELVPEGPEASAGAELERIPLTAGLDLFGLAYERFFPELFKGERGQYFTPRPLVELMVRLADLGDRDRVLDPTCGSGGFLVAAMDRGASIDGIELDPELVALARLNVALHGGDPARVQPGALFRLERSGGWSVVLANPPYSLEVRDPEVLAGLELGRGRRAAGSDALFLEVAWRLLRPGGRLCAVLPHSLLVNRKHVRERSWVDAHFVRRAVVSLPEGVFRPFGGTATRACVVLLERRPAERRPQLAAEIRQPGYDPTRRRFRRTQPDELQDLASFVAGEGTFAGARWVEPDGPWAPGDHLGDPGLGAGVPTVPLGALVQPRRASIDPTSEPEATFTEIDLADLDKSTGEVSSARVRTGAQFRPGQAKTSFREGDLLFGRMRPALNNVGRASRPRPELPGRLVGSGEWVPLEAEEEPWFALMALRSSFVRAQLRTTGGQTRPRARIEDLGEILVPDPGDPARSRLETALGRIHDTRRTLRWQLSRIEAAYEAYGRGEIDVDALMEAIEGDQSPTVPG